MEKNDRSTRRELIGAVIRIILAMASMGLAIYLFLMLGTYIKQNAENNRIKEKYEISETIEPSLPENDSLSLTIQATDSENSGMGESKAAPITQEDAVRIYLQQPLKSYDHAGLKALNADYTAWMDIPGTSISYPVVHSKDNRDYLTCSIEGKKRSSGTIFIDANIHDFKTTKNLVVHGHNMKSGSMFGQLPSYRNMDYYNRHPFVYLYTEDDVMVYQVVSAYVMPHNMDEELAYQHVFSDDEEYEAFVSRLLARSEINTGVDPADRDMLTLSTCVNSSSSRFIVHAVRFQ